MKNMKKIEYHSDDSFATTKYIIKIAYTIHGVVTTMDIIGALFGQTEGLLNDLELRDLQKTGRIGRIQVENNVEKGVSSGNILIPSSLDRVETAILAATIESVDRVGPCSAEMKLNEIQDIREDKRKKIMDRATQLLQKWEQDTPEAEEIGESILAKIRTGELIEFGPEKLPAGEDVPTAEQIIIVEGVADVKQMMKAGFRNAIGTNGTKVPKSVIDLTKKKSAIAFVDGDRGGNMILEELLQVAEIDYIAIAPRGLMVEELMRKGIIKQLQQKKSLKDYLEEKERNKKSRSQSRNNHNGKNEQSKMFKSRQGTRKRGTKSQGRQFKNDSHSRIKSDRQHQQSRSNYKGQKQRIIEPADPKIVDLMKSITASNEAIGLNQKNDSLFRVGNTQVFSNLDTSTDTKVLILDGVVTQRLLDKSIEKKINAIYAINRARNLKFPQGTKISIRMFKDYI